jgi:hypothetical protein
MCRCHWMYTGRTCQTFFFMYAMVSAGGCVLLAVVTWLGVQRAQRKIAAARKKAADSQRELVSVTDDFRELKSVFEINLETELELRETVGQGGFGEVRLAYYHTKDQLVAVKFLRAHLAKDEQSLSEFQREIRLLRTLRHANVITFHVRACLREGGLSFCRLVLTQC